MFRGPEPSTRIVDVAAQRTLPSDENEVAIVSVAVCISAQSVAAINRILSRFGNFLGSNGFAALEFRKVFESLEIPSGWNVAKPCFARWLHFRERTQLHSITFLSIP